MQRASHILNAASNLLGISLLVIAGLQISNHAAKTLADEIAWGATLAFATSCSLAYVAIRSRSDEPRSEVWADAAFLIGLFLLIGAIAVLAMTHIV